MLVPVIITLPLRLIPSIINHIMRLRPLPSLTYCSLVLIFMWIIVPSLIVPVHKVSLSKRIFFNNNIGCLRNLLLVWIILVVIIHIIHIIHIVLVPTPLLAMTSSAMTVSLLWLLLIVLLNNVYLPWFIPWFDVVLVMVPFSLHWGLWWWLCAHGWLRTLLVWSVAVVTAHFRCLFTLFQLAIFFKQIIHFPCLVSWRKGNLLFVSIVASIIGIVSFWL